MYWQTYNRRLGESVYLQVCKMPELWSICVTYTKRQTAIFQMWNVSDNILTISYSAI